MNCLYDTYNTTLNCLYDTYDTTLNCLYDTYNTTLNCLYDTYNTTLNCLYVLNLISCLFCSESFRQSSHVFNDSDSILTMICTFVPLYHCLYISYIDSTEAVIMLYFVAMDTKHTKYYCYGLFMLRLFYSIFAWPHRFTTREILDP